jgi:hypothetical protein
MENHESNAKPTKPQGEPSTICESQDSKNKRDELVRKWVVLFAESYSFQLTPNLPAIWCMALDDLQLEQIETACARLLRTWKLEFGRKFPTPGDVRALITFAEKTAESAKAEKAWQFILQLLASDAYHPDTGLQSRSQGGTWFSERCDEAIRAAGGMRYIATCAEDKLVWAKKSFVEAYQRYEQLEAARPLLASAPDEVAKLVGSVANKKSLPPAK